MKRIFTLLFTAFSVFVSAQNVPADRPGKTMNATTAQAGLWILQTGTDFGTLVNTQNGFSFDSWSFPLDVRYGITDKLEVMVSGSASFAARQDADAGIEYGVLSYAGYLRYNLFDGTNFGSFAFFGGYQHLSYEGGIAAADNIIAKVLYRLPVGDKFQFATNLGYTQTTVNRLDYSVEEGGSFEYTAAFSYLLKPTFGLFLETYGSQGAQTSSWVDGGVFWLPNPDVQWDVILGSGGISKFNQYYVSIGVCFQLGTPR